jgi:hypothetical protein
MGFSEADRWRCRSSPVISGICTSSIRQEVRSTWGERKNPSADAAASTPMSQRLHETLAPRASTRHRRRPPLVPMARRRPTVSAHGHGVSPSRARGAAAVLASNIGTYSYYRGSVVTPYHGGPVVSPARHHFGLSDGALLPDGGVNFHVYLDGGTPAAPAHRSRMFIRPRVGTLF